MLLYIDMRWWNMASAHTLDKANFISFRGSRKTGAAPSGRMWIIEEEGEDRRAGLSTVRPLCVWGW